MWIRWAAFVILNKPTMVAGLPYELPSVAAAPVDADAAAPGVPGQQHAMLLATGAFSAGRCERQHVDATHEFKHL